MYNVIDQEIPGVSAVLKQMNWAQRRSLLITTISYVYRENVGWSDISDSILDKILGGQELTKSDLEAAETLAMSADDQYSELEEGGRDEESLRWFGRARIMTGIRSGFGDQSWEGTADALYEIIKSQEHPDAIIQEINVIIKRLVDER